MSESSQPSYYEIALTNRQVVIAFVFLLTLVLAIFLCGVWVGKNGQARLASTGSSSAEPTASPAEPDQLANMEEFKFFSEDGKGDGGKRPAETLERPDLAVLNPPPKEAPSQQRPSQQSASQQSPNRQTTLAQDIGSEPGPSAAAVPPKAPPSAPTAARQAAPAPPAPAQKQPSPPTRTPTPAPSQAAATDGFVVQVFSTRDEPQARRVLGQLKSAGHKAFLSAVEVTGQTMYRVRVGPFGERQAAERVAGQVRKQMKLDPWVTAAGN